MPLDSKHPEYTERLKDWEQLEHCYQGERVVKEQTTRYLPPTSGMIADGINQTTSQGYKEYMAYRDRAVFPDFVRDAVEAMVGLIHRKPARIELPARMERMLKEATLDGESLQALLRRITEHQILKGRVGLLLDVPDGVTVDKAVPYITVYAAEAIINWRITFGDIWSVVLDESGYEQDNMLQWSWVKKYRMLTMSNVYNNQGYGGNFITTLTKRENAAMPALSEFLSPSIGGKTLDEVPFVFINSADLLPKPDTPPLLGLSNLALAVYRGEADYRQSLFMQGQETLVVIGDEAVDALGKPKQYRTGSGAAIILPEEGDAKYIGISADGLVEQREALANDRRQAANKAAQLLDNTGDGSSDASGEALRVRVAAQTASLTQVATTGAEGLAMILKIAAKWMGLNPDEVIVEPNLEFAADLMTGRELIELQSAKNMGSPISNETIHRQMQRRNLTDKSYEEELDLIAQEEPMIPPTTGTNPNDNQQ